MPSQNQSHNEVTYQKHKIHVSVVGTGHAVLLLHGWPTNSQLWQEQVDFLKSTHRVITFDWLGFGRSDKPRGHPYTFTTMRDILGAVVADLVGDQELVTIIAHDIGGPPAILWSHQHKDRVRQLILLNTILYPLSTPLDRLSHAAFKIPILNGFLVSSAYLKNLMRTLTKSKGRLVSRRIANVLDWSENLTPATKLRTIVEPTEYGRQHEVLTLASKLAHLWSLYSD